MRTDSSKLCTLRMTSTDFTVLSRFAPEQNFSTRPPCSAELWKEPSAYESDNTGSS